MPAGLRQGLLPDDRAGRLHDPATVPDLLAVLRRPPQPAYYLPGDGDAEDRGAPSTLAVFDALGKIGGADAAAKDVYELGTASRRPRRATAPPEFADQAPRDREVPVPRARRQGVESWPRSPATTAPTATPSPTDQLRQAATEAFGAHVRDAKSISTARASRRSTSRVGRERKAADGKPRTDPAEADKVLEQKKEVDELKSG